MRCCTASDARWAHALHAAALCRLQSDLVDLLSSVQGPAPAGQPEAAWAPVRRLGARWAGHLASGEPPSLLHFERACALTTSSASGCLCFFSLLQEGGGAMQAVTCTCTVGENAGYRGTHMLVKLC